MTSKEGSRTPQEKVEDDVKVALVRPGGLTDEDLREAAERLFTALTGKKGKVIKKTAT